MLKKKGELYVVNRDHPAGEKRIRLDHPLFLNVSLNILRVRQILRPNESFYTSPLFPPVSLTIRY